MIKVEVVEQDESVVLYFEARTTDPKSLEELDSLYAVLMTAMKRTALGAKYDCSNKFSIKLNNLV